MWVLKLGGSLARSAHLPQWLDWVSRTPEPLVLVPGGGEFADAVRAFQRRWWIDDASSHELALQAMAQFGRALAALQPALEPRTDVAGLRAAAAGPRIPLWLPTDCAALRRELPASWAVSADSVALWLAEHIGAEGLALVKHLAPGVERLDAGAAAAAALLDAHFPVLFGRCRLPAVLVAERAGRLPALRQRVL